MKNEKLLTWINIDANSFMDNDLETNINQGAGKLPKNTSLRFEEHFSNIEISLIFIRFFFCPTNLIFKFNLGLIE